MLEDVKKKLRIPWSFPLGVCCIARRGKQSVSVSKFCPEIGLGNENFPYINILET
jgi:hypothetical protein